jgi:hypothetical protein
MEFPSGIILTTEEGVGEGDEVDVSDSVGDESLLQLPPKHYALILYGIFW